jgi:hypothetical protein
MGESAYYGVNVEEAARVLHETPDRIREMLATGELEGIPPGAAAEGDWKVLLPASTQEARSAGASQEDVTEEQEEAPPADEPLETPAKDPEETADFVAPPAASDAPVRVVDDSAGETVDEPFREADEGVREDTGGSGWTTTKQAAKVLGVSRRSVQGYVRRGLLNAREEGEGVNKTFLISINSLNALRDRRMREAGEAAKIAEASAEEKRMANLYANTGEVLRHAIERVEARTAEATELRIRLEITEKAESTLRAELEEERRQREAAERERDELRQLLESRPEPREAPVSPAPTEPPPTGAGGGPQEAREATQSAAEILRGPEPHPTTGGAQENLQRAPQPGRRRGRLWRRVFGR